MTEDILEQLLEQRESEHLECKEAKNQFDTDDLFKYCCALANEGGGVLLLGVTDERPRRIVGSHAFTNIERIKHESCSACMSE